VAHVTADTYDGPLAAFAAYCLRRGRPSLPASAATVSEWIKSLWRKGTLVAISLKPILAAVRKRHIAAGHANPCGSSAVREAKARFRRAGLALRPDNQTLRVPLPAAMAWRLALLSSYSPTRLWNHLSAVVLQVWWMRRAGDITLLEVQDVDLSDDGRTWYHLRYHKTAAASLALARSLPAARTALEDLPRRLLARLLSDRRAAGAPPGARLFPDGAAADSSR